MRKLNSSRGQIAIVLMLVIAAALIFYAVSLNVGKFSHTKTVVTMASNAGASKMASQMASYGQVLFMETLGGKRRVCGLTGIAAAIVSIVVIVICIIIIVTSGGSATAIAMAIVGLVLAVISLGIQIAYIQPGITSMWNKIVAETMDMADQFVETGLQTAMQTAVTDSKVIPDLDDLDSDAIFGFRSIGNGQYRAADEYSRYAFYYNERLKDIEILSSTSMQEFKDALQDFVFEDVDTAWGLYDPPECGIDCCYYALGAAVHSYCNPCCLPFDIADPTDTEVPPDALPIRPLCCNIGEVGECGMSAQCTTASLSPYLNGSVGDFPYVYDEHHENYGNDFESFMEKLGWDDEHMDYRKDMSGMIPPAATTFINPNYITGLQQVDDSAHGDFRIEDSLGFADMDGKPGIFSYLWKLMDWGTDLNDALNPIPCQWCDFRRMWRC